MLGGIGGWFGDLGKEEVKHWREVPKYRLHVAVVDGTPVCPKVEGRTLSVVTLDFQFEGPGQLEWFLAKPYVSKEWVLTSSRILRTSAQSGRITEVSSPVFAERLIRLDDVPRGGGWQVSYCFAGPATALVLSRRDLNLVVEAKMKGGGSDPSDRALVPWYARRLGLVMTIFFAGGALLVTAAILGVILGIRRGHNPTV
jgi:hypothetical protein